MILGAFYDALGIESSQALAFFIELGLVSLAAKTGVDFLKEKF